MRTMPKYHYVSRSVIALLPRLVPWLGSTREYTPGLCYTEDSETQQMLPTPCLKSRPPSIENRRLLVQRSLTEKYSSESARETSRA